MIGGEAPKTAKQAFAERMAAMNGGKSNKIEQASQPKADKDAPEVEAEASTETKNTDPTNTRYERARRAMLRDGWKDDEFRKLDREEAIRRGLKREREQNRQAAAIADAKRAAERKVQSSPADAAVSASSNADASAHDRLAELLTKHGIDEDPQAKADLEALLKPILASQPLSETKQRLQKVRAELSASIPELSSEDDWQDVGLVMDRIGNLPKYADAQSNLDTLRMLVRDATMLALDVGERAFDAPVALHGAASRGVIDVTSSRSGSRGTPADPNAEGRRRFVMGMQDYMRGMARSSNN